MNTVNIQYKERYEKEIKKYANKKNLLSGFEFVAIVLKMKDFKNYQDYKKKSL